MKYLSATLIVVSALVGCVSVPMGDPQQDATLKRFAIAPDRAGIFIFRDEALVATTRSDVFLDEAHLGQTAPKTYLYREVTPGRHTITAKTENTATLDVDVAAGSLAFVWLEVTPGMLSQRSNLYLMSEARGREEVLNSRLAESTFPMQVVEVRIDADDPAWGEALDCLASNSVGSWSFAAPGTVNVATSSSPLQITCKVPADVPGASEATGWSSTVVSVQNNVRKGVITGATIGGGIGVALGIAAAPIMGPAIAGALLVGAALKGAEIGGVVGVITAGGSEAYPSPVVVRIRRPSPPD